MTPQERWIRLDTARHYRLTDDGALALLDALMETVAVEEQPERVPAARRSCRRGHGVELRESNGQCRECRRLREKGRGT